MRRGGMLVATAVLLAATAGAGSEQAVTRRRPPDQCRVVTPSAQVAQSRSAREQRAALRQSQARAWAALRESYGERWATLSPRVRRRRRDEIRKGPYFSASSTLDLELGVAVRRSVSPDARLELRLLTPRGHPYQTLKVTLPEAAGPKSAKAAKRQGSRETRRLKAALPVAGTSIVNHSLYGPWKVEPYLNGQSCGPPVRFWIGE